MLPYAGAVGTGLSETVATMLREKFHAIAAPRGAVGGLKVKAPCEERQTCGLRLPTEA